MTGTDVVRGDGLDAHAAGAGARPDRGDVHLVPHVHLPGREPQPAQQGANAAWGDDRRRPVDQAQRGQVQVVEVRVRDEHGVEIAAHHRRRDRAAPNERAHPPPEQRVGEEPNTVHLEKHRRVPREGHRESGRRFVRAHEATLPEMLEPSSLPSRSGAASSPDSLPSSPGTDHMPPRLDRRAGTRRGTTGSSIDGGEKNGRQSQGDPQLVLVGEPRHAHQPLPHAEPRDARPAPARW